MHGISQEPLVGELSLERLGEFLRDFVESRENVVVLELSRNF